MLPDRRSHATLPTADIARLGTFYEDTLGFKPLAERPNAVIYRTADTEAEVAELRSRGVVFQEYETPRTVDGIATIGPGRAAWFQDPDGNLLAVLEWADPV